MKKSKRNYAITLSERYAKRYIRGNFIDFWVVIGTISSNNSSDNSSDNLSLPRPLHNEDPEGLPYFERLTSNYASCETASALVTYGHHCTFTSDLYTTKGSGFIPKKVSCITY